MNKRKLTARIAALEAHCGIPPAADRQPDYLPGQAVEVRVGGSWQQAIYYSPPSPSDAECQYLNYIELPSYKPVTLYNLTKHRIRPVAAVPGCAVRHRVSGELGLVWGQMRVSFAAGSINYAYDPTLHAVIALPPDAADAQEAALKAVQG